MDEAALIRAARLGDQGAFTTLYARHHGAVLGRLVRLCGPDVDDLVQETFERAYRSLRTFRGSSSSAAPLRAWLLQIATHLARSAQRRVRRSLWRLFASEDEERALIDRQRDATSPRAERASVHAALASLSPRLREAVMLYDVEGHTLAEIADELALPLPTVAARVRRGRKALAGVLLLACVLVVTAASAWWTRPTPARLVTPPEIAAPRRLATTHSVVVPRQPRKPRHRKTTKATPEPSQADVTFEPIDEPFGDVIEVARPAKLPPLFDVNEYKARR